jgi:hypothetical protein
MYQKIIRRKQRRIRKIYSKAGEPWSTKPYIARGNIRLNKILAERETFTDTIVNWKWEYTGCLPEGRYVASTWPLADTCREIHLREIV